ncbi:MAG TPA: MBL fold metallo-hydrolase [Ramlibacter sp.]
MNTRFLWPAIAAASLAACATPPQPPTQATVDAHVARATALAGEDLKYLLPVCRPQPAQRPGGPAIEQLLQRMIAAPAPEPGQAFDNLYFVGSGWVSAWVLKTSDGLILIDALNNALEARGLIEGGMRKLGLDPAQIKYLVVTHGHGDHYGGAPMLVEKYRSRVVASAIDWQMMETGLEFDSPQWGRPPRRDIAIKDGDTLTLGDSTITFYVTPGHTLGTISPVFDVKAGGRTHRALIWGGTSFNFGRDMGRLDDYIAQSERMRQVAARRSVDVMLSNHPGYDGTVAKLAALRANPAGPHPFVGGGAVVDRSLQILNECARAQKVRFQVS